MLNATKLMKIYSKISLNWKIILHFNTLTYLESVFFTLWWEIMFEKRSTNQQISLQNIYAKFVNENC